MNDENDKTIEQTSDIESESITNDQELITKVPTVDVDDSPKIEAVNEEPSKKETPSCDISKVRIRDILKQRFKKMGPGLKKVLPLILVGVICFAAGMGVGRAFIGRRVTKDLRNRPGIKQYIPKNGNDGIQGNMRNNKNMPNRFNNRIK